MGKYVKKVLIFSAFLLCLFALTVLGAGAATGAAEQGESSVASMALDGTTYYYDSLSAALEDIPAGGSGEIQLLKAISASSLQLDITNKHVTLVGLGASGYDVTMSGEHLARLNTAGSITFKNMKIKTSYRLVHLYAATDATLLPETAADRDTAVSFVNSTVDTTAIQVVASTSHYGDMNPDGIPGDTFTFSVDATSAINMTTASTGSISPIYAWHNNINYLVVNVAGTVHIKTTGASPSSLYVVGMNNPKKATVTFAEGSHLIVDTANAPASTSAYILYTTTGSSNTLTMDYSALVDENGNATIDGLIPVGGPSTTFSFTGTAPAIKDNAMAESLGLFRVGDVTSGVIGTNYFHSLSAAIAGVADGATATIYVPYCGGYEIGSISIVNKDITVVSANTSKISTVYSRATTLFAMGDASTLLVKDIHFKVATGFIKKNNTTADTPIKITLDRGAFVELTNYTTSGYFFYAEYNSTNALLTLDVNEGAEIKLKSTSTTAKSSLTANHAGLFQVNQAFTGGSKININGKIEFSLVWKDGSTGSAPMFLLQGGATKLNLYVNSTAELIMNHTNDAVGTSNVFARMCLNYGIYFRGATLISNSKNVGIVSFNKDGLGSPVEIDGCDVSGMAASFFIWVADGGSGTNSSKISVKNFTVPEGKTLTTNATLSKLVLSNVGFESLAAAQQEATIYYSANGKYFTSGTYSAAVAAALAAPDKTLYVYHDTSSNSYTLDSKSLIVEGVANSDGEYPAFTAVSKCFILKGNSNLTLKNLNLSASKANTVLFGASSSALLNGSATVTWENCDVSWSGASGVHYGYCAETDTMTINLIDSTFNAQTAGNAILNTTNANGTYNITATDCVLNCPLANDACAATGTTVIQFTTDENAVREGYYYRVGDTEGGAVGTVYFATKAEATAVGTPVGIANMANDAEAIECGAFLRIGTTEGGAFGVVYFTSLAEAFEVATEAGVDTIYVIADGTEAVTLTLNETILKLVGVGSTKPTVTYNGTAALFLVSKDVTLSIENVDFVSSKWLVELQKGIEGNADYGYNPLGTANLTFTNVSVDAADDIIKGYRGTNGTINLTVSNGKWQSGSFVMDTATQYGGNGVKLVNVDFDDLEIIAGLFYSEWTTTFVGTFDNVTATNVGNSYMIKGMNNKTTYTLTLNNCVLDAVGGHILANANNSSNVFTFNGTNTVFKNNGSRALFAANGGQKVILNLDNSGLGDQVSLSTDGKNTLFLDNSPTSTACTFTANLKNVNYNTKSWYTTTDTSYAVLMTLTLDGVKNVGSAATLDFLGASGSKITVLNSPALNVTSTITGACTLVTVQGTANYNALTANAASTVTYGYVRIGEEGDNALYYDTLAHAIAAVPANSQNTNVYILAADKVTFSGELALEKGQWVTLIGPDEDLTSGVDISTTGYFGLRRNSKLVLKNVNFRSTGRIAGVSDHYINDSGEDPDVAKGTEIRFELQNSVAITTGTIGIYVRNLMAQGTLVIRIDEDSTFGMEYATPTDNLLRCERNDLGEGSEIIIEGTIKYITSSTKYAFALAGDIKLTIASTAVIDCQGGGLVNFTNAAPVLALGIEKPTAYTLAVGSEVLYTYLSDTVAVSFDMLYRVGDNEGGAEGEIYFVSYADALVAANSVADDVHLIGTLSFADDTAAIAGGMAYRVGATEGGLYGAVYFVSLIDAQAYADANGMEITYLQQLTQEQAMEQGATVRVGEAVETGLMGVHFFATLEEAMRTVQSGQTVYVLATQNIEGDLAILPPAGVTNVKITREGFTDVMFNITAGTLTVANLEIPTATNVFTLSGAGSLVIGDADTSVKTHVHGDVGVRVSSLILVSAANTGSITLEADSVVGIDSISYVGGDSANTGNTNNAMIRVINIEGALTGNIDLKGHLYAIYDGSNGVAEIPAYDSEAGTGVNFRKEYAALFLVGAAVNGNINISGSVYNASGSAWYAILLGANVTGKITITNATVHAYSTVITTSSGKFAEIEIGQDAVIKHTALTSSKWAAAIYFRGGKQILRVKDNAIISTGEEGSAINNGLFYLGGSRGAEFYFEDTATLTNYLTGGYSAIFMDNETSAYVSIGDDVTLNYTYRYINGGGGQGLFFADEQSMINFGFTPTGTILVKNKSGDEVGYLPSLAQAAIWPVNTDVVYVLSDLNEPDIIWFKPNRTITVVGVAKEDGSYPTITVADTAYDNTYSFFTLSGVSATSVRSISFENVILDLNACKGFFFDQNQKDHGTVNLTFDNVNMTGPTDLFRIAKNSNSPFNIVIKGSTDPNHPTKWSAANDAGIIFNSYQGSGSVVTRQITLDVDNMTFGGTFFRGYGALWGTESARATFDNCTFLDTGSNEYTFCLFSYSKAWLEFNNCTWNTYSGFHRPGDDASAADYRFINCEFTYNTNSAKSYPLFSFRNGVNAKLYMENVDIQTAHGTAVFWITSSTAANPTLDITLKDVVLNVDKLFDSDTTAVSMTASFDNVQTVHDKAVTFNLNCANASTLNITGSKLLLSVANSENVAITLDEATGVASGYVRVGDTKGGLLGTVYFVSLNDAINAIPENTVVDGNITRVVSTIYLLKDNMTISSTPDKISNKSFRLTSVGVSEGGSIRPLKVTFTKNNPFCLYDSSQLILGYIDAIFTKRFLRFETNQYNGDISLVMESGATVHAAPSSTDGAFIFCPFGEGKITIDIQEGATIIREAAGTTHAMLFNLTQSGFAEGSTVTIAGTIKSTCTVPTNGEFSLFRCASPNVVLTIEPTARFIANVTGAKPNSTAGAMISHAGTIYLECGGSAEDPQFKSEGDGVPSVFAPFAGTVLYITGTPTYTLGSAATGNYSAMFSTEAIAVVADIEANILAHFGGSLSLAGDSTRFYNLQAALKLVQNGGTIYLNSDYKVHGQHTVANKTFTLTSAEGGSYKLYSERGGNHADRILACTGACNVTLQNVTLQADGRVMIFSATAADAPASLSMINAKMIATASGNAANAILCVGNESAEYFDLFVDKDSEMGYRDVADPSKLAAGRNYQVIFYYGSITGDIRIDGHVYSYVYCNGANVNYADDNNNTAPDSQSIFQIGYGSHNFDGDIVITGRITMKVVYPDVEITPEISSRHRATAFHLIASRASVFVADGAVIELDLVNANEDSGLCYFNFGPVNSMKATYERTGESTLTGTLYYATLTSKLLFESKAPYTGSYVTVTPESSANTAFVHSSNATWINATGGTSGYRDYQFAKELSEYLNTLLGGSSTYIADSAFATLEILVGRPERAEVSALLPTIGVNEYAIFYVDGKILLLAWQEAALVRCVEDFKVMLTAFTSEIDGVMTLKLPAQLIVGEVVANSNWVEDFTRPSGAELSLFAAQYVGDGSMQFLYTGNGATQAAYNAYVAALLGEGYTVVWENAIGENRFVMLKHEQKGISLYVAYNDYTFANNYTYDNVAYDGLTEHLVADIQKYGYLKCIRIVSAKLTSITLPDAGMNTPNPTYQKVTDSTLTTLSFESGDVGMGYVLMLEDGRFVVIDGGRNNAEQIWNVLNALYKRVNGADSEPTAEKPIHIAAYYLTHAHSDHYGSFKDLLATYGRTGKLKMDYMIGNFPATYSIFGTLDWGDCTDDIKTMQDNIVGGFKFVKVHAGQRIYLANLEIEVLMTYEDHLPYRIINTNDTNTVTRFTLKNADAMPGVEAPTILFLGDSWRYTSRLLGAMYGDYLHVDVMQLAHHGNIGCEKLLYEIIQPIAVLFPHTESGMQGYAYWYTISEKNKPHTYAYQADKYVVQQCPSVRFVWAAKVGSDNTLVFTPAGPDYHNVFDIFTGEKITYGTSAFSEPYYYKRGTDVISINVYWGDLSFFFEAGEWNPETHEYEGGNGWQNDGDSTVTVENAGDIDVSVGIQYTAASGYEYITGAITDEAGATVAANAKYGLPILERYTFNFELTGTDAPSTPLDDVTVGSITVTVTRAGG